MQTEALLDTVQSISTLSVNQLPLPTHPSPLSRSSPLFPQRTCLLYLHVQIVAANASFRVLICLALLIFIYIALLL